MIGENCLHSQSFEWRIIDELEAVAGSAQGQGIN